MRTNGRSIFGQSTGVLVKPDIARKQFDAEMAAVPAPPDSGASAAGT